MRRIEQETVINFNAEEDTASIYTADPVMIRRLDRLTETHPQHYQLINRTDISKTYGHSVSMNYTENGPESRCRK